LTEKLPYQLTNAQLRVLQEVKHDMRSPYAMQRLIQGDVGSGKTILAFLAMADCYHNGYQSAIMAPTEVLAQQHYESFQNMCRLFELAIPLILITGSMTAKQKKEAYAKLQEHKNAMVIGTHALIQEKVGVAVEAINFDFFGLNLSLTPDLKFISWLWVIPILSAITSYLVSIISRQLSGNSAANEQMKTMNIIMPLMSGYFCFIMPAGVGVYWVASNIMQVIQQTLLTMYYKRKDEKEKQ